MTQDDKIKCVVSDIGTILPINNIAIISGKHYSHYVWTNADGYDSSYGHKLSDEQYNALMKELKML